MDVEKHMNAARWSLGRALVWIATRDEEATSYDSVGLTTVSIWRAQHPDAELVYPTNKAAWHALCEKLADGKLRLFGTVKMEARGLMQAKRGVVPQSNDGPVFPSANEPDAARHFVLRESGNGAVELVHGNHAIAFSWPAVTDIQLCRADVMREFPPPRRRISKADTERLYLKYVKAAGGKTTKDQDQAWAKKQGISRANVRLLRKTFGPLGGRRGGRPETGRKS